MRRDFGVAFITQCAPVMAGLKPANLFRWVEPDARAMYATIESWRAQLGPRGVRITVLKACARTSAFLIYVYRAAPLEKILRRGEVRTYLEQSGYPGGTLEQRLAYLSARLCTEAEFPHEIGIFLGYHLEDVIGFVRHKGKNYTCKGYWKAYGDPEAACARFASYRKCTDVYLRCYRNGFSPARLTVAA